VKSSSKPMSAALALWGWPIVFAVVTAIGLIGALVGNGSRDWLAWIGLGLPAAASLWFGLRRSRARR
jgi:hypothetical protein